MRPRNIAVIIIGTITLISIANSILGNIVASLLQEKLGDHAGVVIVPFVVLAAVLFGYELRSQLSGLTVRELIPTRKSWLHRNRTRMLDRVEHVWIKGMLEASLYRIAQIELDLKYDPTAIGLPWEAIVQHHNIPDRKISSSKQILYIFLEMGSELLILGAPGAGKTTLLLELTRDLIEQARNDESQPIPVVFNLSTWAARRRPLEEWLVEELITKYDLPRKLAKEWVDGNDIALLLDGLDEVHQNYREACVEAINTYRRETGLTSIVVCSRTADYEPLTLKLRLQGAVVIQPLAPNQIETYFSQSPFWHIKAMLKDDTQLQSLIDNPLMITIVVLAFAKKQSVSSTSASTLAERRDKLFDAYIDAMFERRAKTERYNREHTIGFLTWLSSAMQRNSQTIFLLERLQPEWLETPLQKGIFFVFDRLVWPFALGLGIGLVLLLVAFFVEHNGLIVYFVRVDATYIHSISLGLIPSYALLISVLTVVCGILFGGVDLSVSKRQQRIRDVLFGAIIVGVVGYLSPMLNDRIDFPGYVYNYLLIGALIGLMVSAIGGGPGLQARHIYVVEKVRWSPFRGLILTISTILFTVFVWCVSNWIFGWIFLPLTSSPLLNGIIAGIVFGLIFGVLGGIVPGEIEIKTSPNQGISQSIFTSLLVGIGVMAGGGATGLLFGGIVAANPGNILLGSFIYSGNGEPMPFLLAGLIAGLSEIIPFAILAALSYGGFASMSHYSLRIALWLSGAAPPAYVRFLDHCVERVFLRRVGGGYSFTHRLLMERFANIPSRNLET